MYGFDLYQSQIKNGIVFSESGFYEVRERPGL